MLVSSGSRSGSWQSPQAALAAPLALAEQGEGEGEGHHCDGGREILDSEEHGSWDPCLKILDWWTRVEWSNIYRTYVKKTMQNLFKDPMQQFRNQFLLQGEGKEEVVDCDNRSSSQK